MTLMFFSNDKLFHRAVGIIKDIATVTEGVAKNCLLRSIYEDQLPSKDDITAHIQKATEMKKVVVILLTPHLLPWYYHTGGTYCTAISPNIKTLHCSEC